MKLTREQLFEFEQALLSAYPTTSSLTRMLKFELDVNLIQVASGGNFTDIVFNLIIWAQSKGRIEELITKSHNFNPGNARLSAFASQFSTPQPDSSAIPSPSSSAGQDTQRSQPSQPMKKMTSRQMRIKLKAIDDIALNELLIDYFPEVHNRFSVGMLKDSKINWLLDYCRRADGRKVLLQEALEEFS